MVFDTISYHGCIHNKLIALFIMRFVLFNLQTLKKCNVYLFVQDKYLIYTILHI